MAMGFPQNAYIQQNALAKNQKLSENRKELLSNMVVMEIGEEKEIRDFSLVEIISNFILKIFKQDGLSPQSIISQTIENKRYHIDFIAIKNDFEYSLIS